MKFKLLLGIVISFAFLFWAFWDVDFAGFWSALKTARYRYFALAVVFSVAQYFVRAYRWKYLLILQKNISFPSVLSALFIGFFGNTVLPFRAGEFLRAYVIGKNEHIPKSAVLATVLVERIIDVLSLLLVAVIALFFLPVPESLHYDMIKNFGAILFAVEIGVIFFCFMLLLKRKVALKVIETVLGVFSGTIQKKGEVIVLSFLDGLEILRSTRHIFRLVITTTVIWLLVLLQCYAVLSAFGVSYGILTMFVIVTVNMVLVSFALTIPSAPGFVGTFHAAAKEGLAIFSIDPAIASGFAVLLHASSFLPPIIGGFYYFLQENIKLSSAHSEFKSDEVSREMR